jgi:hypothetical protein
MDTRELIGAIMIDIEDAAGKLEKEVRFSLVKKLTRKIEQFDAETFIQGKNAGYRMGRFAEQDGLEYHHFSLMND